MTTEADNAVGERHRLVVHGAAPDRVDVYVARHVPDLSRARVADLLGRGRVRLNGRVPRKSERVAEGDVIDVELPPPEPSALVPEPIALNIVYEDEDLLVIDKPAGLVVHPAPGHRTGTLVHALLHHVGDLSGIGGVLRPGIVHRLDKDTSGLILVAKNDRAHGRLAAALRRREIRRAYLVAAWGHFDEDEFTVDAPVGRSTRDRKRMTVTEAGRPAVTHFRLLERWRAADLLRAELETGRTHQIRVHLQDRGHPVVGDPVYGAGAERGISGPAAPWARELARRVGRQFLHAAELEFRHPRTAEPVSIRSPLPEDLAGPAEWARRSSTPDRES